MSLVNEMLRDLDKRRQSSPTAELANSPRPAAPRQQPVSTTRWLPLALLTLLVLVGAGGLWLYDNPQLWRRVEPAVVPAAVVTPAPPVKVAAAPEAQPAIIQVASQVQVTDVSWTEGPTVQLALTLTQAPPQRVLLSTPRTLQLDLGAVALGTELPEPTAALIRSAQFVNQNGHLTLELETYQDAIFRVVGRNGDQQHRLALSIDPVAPPPVVGTAKMVEPVTAPVSSSKPTPAGSEKTVAPDREAMPGVAKPDPVKPSLPTATLRKSAPQSLEQRDQAVVAQALEQVNRRQLAQAQQLLESLVQQEPGASSSRTLLATLKIGAQQSDQAESLIDAGLELDRTHAGLRKLKARLLIQRGELTDAVRLLGENHPDVSSDSEFHQIRAAALQAAGEHQQAAEAYHRLLQLRASEPRWWIGLAMSLEALQQPQQAKQAYQNVFKIPQVPPVLADFVSQRLAQLGG